MKFSVVAGIVIHVALITATLVPQKTDPFQSPRPGNGQKTNNCNSCGVVIGSGDSSIRGNIGINGIGGNNGNSTLATCIPTKRREWRSIKPLERVNYLKAVQCLQNKTENSGLCGARSRFDDFQGLHICLTDQVHGVGQFLPWHRWFLHVYEKALRDECNYTGHIPYWDWTKDADPAHPEAFLSSKIFDPIEGFGNLPLVQGPLSSGVFANYQLIFGMGPYPNLTSHPLERGFNATWLPGLTETMVKRTLSNTTFEAFRIELEGWRIHRPKIHNSGHNIIGGDMSDLHSSPADPLFYLHHANLDRVWWMWQSADKQNRLYQISGRSTQNDSYHNVTLDTTLPTGTFEQQPVTIRQVMDIENQPLCYTYD